MNDLTATRLCAEAMGINPLDMPICQQCEEYGTEWEPLENDAQAMALVKRFNVHCIRHSNRGNETWWANTTGGLFKQGVNEDDLNRAIVYCVAAMQEAKNG